MKVFKTAIINSLIFLLLNLTTLICNAQSWSLSGNSGTTNASFLGTQDQKPPVFKTNKTERMRMTKTGEIYIGTAYSLNVENRASGIQISVPANTLGTTKKTFPIRSRSNQKLGPQKAQLTIMTCRSFLAGWEN